MVISWSSPRQVSRRVKLVKSPERVCYIVCNVNPGFERANPWTLNLHANPTAQVQIGKVRSGYQAREASQAEVDRYWPHLVAVWPAYQTFYNRSGQRFVFVLEPIEGPHSATSGEKMR